MSTVVRAVMAWTASSGLPADDVVNVWHFRTTALGTSVADPGNIADMVEDYYTAIPVGDTEAIASAYSAALSGSYRIDLYNLSDASPRVPFFSRTGTHTVGTNLFPAEVALCCSFQGPQVSGVPQARNRGRVYLGPWIQSTGVNDVTTGRPATGLVTRIRRAARDLIDASDASLNNKWVVYSPTKDATQTLQDSTVDVTDGWVDNAWDTQRRRGPQATTRSVFDDSTP